MQVAATGNPRVDRVLVETVTAFEQAFPGRVRGYYLAGSQADMTGLPTSDLDLDIIFKDRWADDEGPRARALVAAYAARSTVEYDVAVLDEAALAGGLPPALKLGSLLVAGEDIRAHFPLLPLPAWTRDRMHAAYWLIVRVFDRPAPGPGPLAYPDPTGEFFGYTRRLLHLPDGTVRAGTRDLIRVTGWVATARLALEAGHYAARKRDCRLLYRAAIGDEWTPYLEALYDQCRTAWAYHVPAAPAARAALRALCAETLRFERDFLGRYRRYLLAELAGVGPARERALWVQGQIPWTDPEVQATVRAAQTAMGQPA